MQTKSKIDLNSNRFIASRSTSIVESYYTSEQLEPCSDKRNLSENTEDFENEVDELQEPFTSYLQQKILGVDICTCAYLRSWASVNQPNSESKCNCMYRPKSNSRSRCSVLN